MVYSEILNRRIHQFLVHSFLYYKLDVSLISDHHYDRICRELFELKAQNSEEWKRHKFAPYIKQLDLSGSGFYIKEYPPEIISRALHLLYRHTNPPIPFDVFIARWGYSLK